MRLGGKWLQASQASGKEDICLSARCGKRLWRTLDNCTCLNGLQNIFLLSCQRVLPVQPPAGPRLARKDHLRCCYHRPCCFLARGRDLDWGAVGCTQQSRGFHCWAAKEGSVSAAIPQKPSECFLEEGRGHSPVSLHPRAHFPAPRRMVGGRCPSF